MMENDALFHAEKRSGLSESRRSQLQLVIIVHCDLIVASNYPPESQTKASVLTSSDVAASKESAFTAKSCVDALFFFLLLRWGKEGGFQDFHH